MCETQNTKQKKTTMNEIKVQTGTLQDLNKTIKEAQLRGGFPFVEGDVVEITEGTGTFYGKVGGVRTPMEFSGMVVNVPLKVVNDKYTESPSGDKTVSYLNIEGTYNNSFSTGVLGTLTKAAETTRQFEVVSTSSRTVEYVDKKGEKREIEIFTLTEAKIVESELAE